MKNRIFEILVDKNNEKWPDVFEHILIILHKVFDKVSEKIFFKDIRELHTFSFEITKIAWKIRFFLICPENYADFIKNQFYAQYADIEINEIKDYLIRVPSEKITLWSIGLEKNTLFPIKTIEDFAKESSKSKIDTYSSITSSLSKANEFSLNTIQINFHPISDDIWKKNIDLTTKILNQEKNEDSKEDLNKTLNLLKLGFVPISMFFKFIMILIKPENYKKYKKQNEEKKKKEEENIKIIEEEKKPEELPKEVKEKLWYLWFACNINIISASENDLESKSNVNEMFSTFGIFSWNNSNSFNLISLNKNQEKVDLAKQRKLNNYFILNTKELAWIVHLPTNYVKTPNINWVSSRNFETPANLPIIWEIKDDEITPIWKANFRWKNTDFWILKDDRRRHMYVVWKTGMGKTTLLENMILDDIKKWRWVALIDPHWDLVENIIWQIPKNRTNSVIVFDPSDTSWPIWFNMFDWVDEEQRTLIASGLLWIFKKIFGNVSWWPRLEYILRNTILSLLEFPWATLLSIPLMLTSEVYRKRVIAKITDPVVKKFWINEFERLSPSQKTEAVSPILNKVWQFVSSPLLRNILWQQKNSFYIRWAMDNQKIIIVNLSKWKIWEDASSLLWAMLVTKFQLDAMSRADIKENERKDFYLYVDEFQNFATDSFSTILSEARKYKLNLIMANQYIDQMNDEVRRAVFWNVWSIVSFQVWHNDAKLLKDVFAWWITENDFMNLKNHAIYTKLLISWMPSSTFSALTYPPTDKDEKEFKERYEKVLHVNRQKYCKEKEKVEKSIERTMEDLEKMEKGKTKNKKM